MKFVASALRLYLFEAIWRHSTTSTGRSCSIGTWSQSKRLSSTLLRNYQPPAYTHARCHSVAAIPAPGSIYTKKFLMQHPQDLVCIPIKGSLPLLQCARCGLQTPVKDLGRCHHCTGLCQRGWERKCQHEAAVRSQQALEHTFRTNGEELGRVEVFKYLGRLILFDDADNQAIGE